MAIFSPLSRICGLLGQTPNQHFLEALLPTRRQIGSNLLSGFHCLQVAHDLLACEALGVGNLGCQGGAMLLQVELDVAVVDHVIPFRGW